ncbi:hypothetical protein [Pedobacter sp. W3I1]|nr:hypothetical protein [Pedobacter sp. W3I1]
MAAAHSACFTMAVSFAFRKRTKSSIIGY